MKDDNAIKELLTPDNNNIRRGVILVCAATMLGVFLTIQAVDGDKKTILAAQSDQDEKLETTTTQRKTSASELNPASPKGANGTIISEEDLETTSSSGSEVDQDSTQDYSEFVVQVFNGSREPGIAADLSAEIKSFGYQTRTPGDTPSSVQNTQILYADGFKNLAYELAEQLDADDVDIELISTRTRPINDVSGITLIVILGKDNKIIGG